jgi:hypothetical protein
MSRFIIMTASAKMPSSCKGTYRRIAVVETDLPDGEKPKMISDHAKGVVRIVETWERLNCGKTERSAYARALHEAEVMVASLEAGDQPSLADLS